MSRPSDCEEKSMNASRLTLATLLVAATLPACSGIPEDSVHTNVRREDGKVWIDGVKLWITADRGSSVHAAQAAIMEVVGEDVSYTDLVGASGLAFRLQVAPSLCPSSPHSSCGEQCGAGAVNALTWQIRTYGVDPSDSAGVAEARQAIVESIDRGVPVQYGCEEDGLIVGYQSNGDEWLCLHPYKGDTVFVETDWPWGIAVFTAPKEAAPNRREVAAAAIQKAVRMAHAESADGYPIGFHAWDVWLAKLASLEIADEGTRNGHMLGNSWIYGTLVEYRGIAAEYLTSVASEFDETTAAHLLAAAALYDRMAKEILADDAHCVTEIAPLPWMLGEGETWTAATHSDQMRRMRNALPLERQAVAELEAALASM